MRVGRDRLLPMIGLAALGLLTMLVYLPGLAAPFVLDDQYFFVNDAFFTGGFAQVVESFAVRILPSATFWLDAHWHGNGDPMPWRIENLILHLIAATFVYLLARELFTDKRHTTPGTDASLERMAPLAVAALFSLHPLQTQAVTYVWQRQTAMAALFYVVALWAYARSCARQNAFDQRGDARWTAVMLIAGTLAMISKQNAVTLPLSLILTHVLLTGLKPSGLRSVWPILACAALTLLPVGLGQVFGDMALNDIHDATVRTISPTTYAINEISVIWRYVALYFWPAKQAFVHDIVVATELSPSLVFGLGAHLAVIFCAIKLRHWRPLLTFGIVFFYLTLMPESSVIPLEDLMFEHRMYLPSLGLAIAFVDAFLRALEALQNTWSSSPRSMRWSFAVGTLTVASLLASLTARRNKTWTSELALWEEVAETYPTSLRAALAIGIIEMGKGDCDGALARLTNLALDIDGSAPRVVSGALFVRGQCLAVKGDDAAAERALRAAIGLMKSNGSAHSALTVLLARQGKLQDALMASNEAVAHAQLDIAPHITQAFILEDLGRKEEALVVARRVVARANCVPRSRYKEVAALAERLGDMALAADASRLADEP